MNVLAAPFLYTLPSELEAFYCFARFIEVSCPLYVQPTLEGVHKGLKVRSTPLGLLIRHVPTYNYHTSKSPPIPYFSFSIDA